MHQFFRLLVFITLSNDVFADDRLDQLIETLTNSSYTHPDLDHNYTESSQQVTNKSQQKLSDDPQKIYIYKDNDENILLTKNRMDEGTYKDVKVTYYPESDIHQRNKWLISTCEKDRFNGNKFCAMSKSSLMISIYNGTSRIYVGSKHFPGKQSAIKIDEGKTFYGYEGHFKNNAVIFPLLIKGKMVYTRHVQWPYEYNVDNEISLDGFSDAYKELKRRYSEL